MIIFNFYYSPKYEIKYIEYVRNKISWYQKMGYNPNLPEGIDDQSSKSHIIEIVNSDYKENIESYKRIRQEIKKELKEKNKELNNFLNNLDYPIPKKIFVYFTLYGPGGSYLPPKEIIIRFNKSFLAKNLLRKIIHETIHLIIEKPVIQKYNISHWEKENIVNSFFNYPILKNIFPEYKFPVNYSFPADKIKLIKFKKIPSWLLPRRD